MKVYTLSRIAGNISKQSKPRVDTIDREGKRAIATRFVLAQVSQQAIKEYKVRKFILKLSCRLVLRRFNPIETITLNYL